MSSTNFIVYGTKVKSDIAFPLQLPHEIETRYEVKLSVLQPNKTPCPLTCSLPIYSAHGRLVYLYSNNGFDSNDAQQSWCYEVKGVLKFYWNSNDRNIYYQIDANSDAHLLSFWFIHLFLPLYLTLENMYEFLHAAAVEVAGQPILFIAPSMGGKSTMADYFIKQGHLLISDDKVPTFFNEGEFKVAGAHPYHRPYRKYEELGYHIDHFSKTFNPIHSFYALEGGAANINITIKEIKGFKKFDTVLSSSLYKFSHLKQKRLQYLSKMLNNINVYCVQVPWDLYRLNEVHDAICAHTKKLASLP